MLRFLGMMFRRGADTILFACAFLITCFGLAGIFSLDKGQALAGLPFFTRQLMAFGIGLLLFFIFSRFEYRLFQFISSTWYVLGIAFMILVLFFGQTIRGTTGWFIIAGFSFQPVEFMKAALIVHLAHFFSRNRDHFKTAWVIVGSGILTAVPVLLTLFQPDAGSALLMIGTWFIMLLVSGVRRVHVVSGAVIALVAIAISWQFLLVEYQKERIRTFFDPTHDVRGSGYNVRQAIIAVGSGQFFGKGLGYGSQSQLRFLPEARTDFMFASLSEELGFFGVGILLLLCGTMQIRMIRIAQGSHDDFGVFVIFGYVSLLMFQTLINGGMNMGILPVTGIVFPLVSYGGSALIAQWLLLSVVLQVSRASIHKGHDIG